MVTNTAEIRVGRLLEIRADAGYSTVAQVDALFDRVEAAIAKLRPTDRNITIADWRLCPVMEAKASERLVQPRPNEGVDRWFDGIESEHLFLSVLVLSELRHGVAVKRRRDPVAAIPLGAWVDQLETLYRSRILKVDRRVARAWAELGVPDPVPPIDSLLAATALVHDLTLVTRNVKDVQRTGARILNPFVER